MDNARTTNVVAQVATAAFFFVLAWLQTTSAILDRPPSGQDWFLFGGDTVAHDIPVQLTLWRAFSAGGGELPLWLPELKGGLPTVGAFLWTPLAPSLWLHAVLPFPLAQRLQFLLAFWWGGLGAFWLGRTLGMRRSVALLVGVGFGVCGHVVTLVHAGHLQKILALAWLPWLAGGTVKAFAADGTAAWRGVAAAGLALGMAFLSGHPQIGWTMLAIVGLRTAYAAVASRRVLRIAARAAAIVAVGGMVASAQMIPGLETSRLSNRADGVAWDEAVQSSYPPSELPELFLPRFRGDSSRAGAALYLGEWNGERLVSDYVGAFVALLAVGAVLVRARRREAAFWWFVAAFFLAVGVGRHAPLYRALYEVAPGFRSFRSPGTFMAGAALALPVLAGFGMEGMAGALAADDRRAFRVVKTAGIGAIACALLWALGQLHSVPSFSTLDGDAEIGRDDVWREALLWSSLGRSALVVGVGLLFVPAAFALLRLSRRFAWVLPAGIAILTAGDLVSANAAFLSAEPWKNYLAGYVAPSEIDMRLANERRPLRVFEAGREMSMRPVLSGRDALLGYHPISYRVFEDNLAELGIGTPAWRDLWGVRWIAASDIPADAPDLEAVVTLADGRDLVLDRATREPVRADKAEALAAWQWLLREPNETILEVTTREATTVEIAEMRAPGWRSEPPAETADAMLRRTPVPAGTSEIRWVYRPASWSRGVFLTALGALAAAAIFVGASSRKRK